MKRVFAALHTDPAQFVTVLVLSCVTAGAYLVFESKHFDPLTLTAWALFWPLVAFVVNFVDPSC